MFVRKFKYTFKSLLRNKALIFWTFVFPLILVSFFKMAFSNIEKEERYNPSNIAIINDESFNEFIIYKETFKSLSDEKNDNRLFNVLYVDEEKAKKLLNDDEIIGYFSIKDDEPKVTVKQNGIYQTVLTSVVEERKDLNVKAKKLRGEVLGLDKLMPWDSVLDLAKDNKEYTIEDAKELLFEALAPLGEDYLRHFKHIFDSKSIDFSRTLL